MAKILESACLMRIQILILELNICKTLIDRYHNIEVALAAYNAGIGTVDGWIEKRYYKC